MRNDPARERPMRRPWLPLLSALLDLTEGKGQLLRHSERPWASITFSGTRHTVALSFTGCEAVAAGERFIEALPEHEFTLARQLVADAAATRVEHTLLPEPEMIVEAEILLLDDC
jgi:hypothetical protein